MTKIIKYPNPDVSQLEVSYLTEDKNAGETTLTVQNTTGFSPDDYIIIEQVGNEYAEMHQIDSIADISTLVLKTPIQHSHGKLTKIIKTLFNQVRLYRSADGTNYTLIQTKEINWQDKYNQVVFVDTTGSDEYWYKVEYFNSTNSLSIFSSPIKTPTKIGYLTVEEFKRETGIKGDDDTIAHALKYGSQEIFRKLFTGRQWKTATPNTEFELPVEVLEFADANLDGIIDRDDFLVWEEDVDGVRTYVTSDIASIDVDRHIITFNNPHPAPNKTLVFEYQLTYRKLVELDEALRRLNMLFAVNYLFRNIPFKRLQRGIGSWSINGVSVNFESSMLTDVIKSNSEEINHIIGMIGRIYSKKTAIRKPTPVGLSYIKSTLNFKSS